jgi:hypothetical protein
MALANLRSGRSLHLSPALSLALIPGREPALDSAPAKAMPGGFPAAVADALCGDASDAGRRSLVPGRVASIPDRSAFRPGWSPVGHGRSTGRGSSPGFKACVPVVRGRVRAALGADPRVARRASRRALPSCDWRALGQFLPWLLLLATAFFSAPEAPQDQAAICQRHNGEAACRVW